MERLEDLSDAALIERSLRQPRCFEAVFDRHFMSVLRYLRGRVGDDLADDLAGDVFERAYAGRERYVASSGSALPWLLGIATNVIRMSARSERRRIAALGRLARERVSAGELPDAPDPRIVSAIAALSPEHRDVLLLHCLADLTHQQIAIALDLAPGTARSYLSRARAALAASLAPAPIEEVR